MSTRDGCNSTIRNAVVAAASQGPAGTTPALPCRRVNLDTPRQGTNVKVRHLKVRLDDQICGRVESVMAARGSGHGGVYRCYTVDATSYREQLMPSWLFDAPAYIPFLRGVGSDQRATPPERWTRGRAPSNSTGKPAPSSQQTCGRGKS